MVVHEDIAVNLSFSRMVKIADPPPYTTSRGSGAGMFVETSVSTNKDSPRGTGPTTFAETMATKHSVNKKTGRLMPQKVPW